MSAQLNHADRSEPEQPVPQPEPIELPPDAPPADPDGNELQMPEE